MLDEELPSKVDSDYELPAAEEPVDQFDDEDSDIHNTMFDLEDAELAEIDFGESAIGRWLVKVVSGPNLGAEFYMQSGQDYKIGTDPNSCDIIFHDNSVSRSHAKITVTEDDELFIEDLNSRNGILIAGNKLETKESLPLKTLINIGTTSIIVYDREGEMHTIISPLLPSIVNSLKSEPKSLEPETSDLQPESFEPKSDFSDPEEKKPESTPPKSNFNKLFILGFVALFSASVIFGLVSLFKTTPVEEKVTPNGEEQLKKVLAPFPTVKWSYNKASGGVLLLGHVATDAEKNQLLYKLHSMSSVVKSIDDTGLVIDEGVWREINSIINKNPQWRGITVHSPEAGKFVLSGNLQTKKEAEQLYDYISANFPYLDLLKKDVVVDEDVMQRTRSILLDANLPAVKVSLQNGEVSLTGFISSSMEPVLEKAIEVIKKIDGVRAVYDFTEIKDVDHREKNISSQYRVTGSTKIGNDYTVQINGKILSTGDYLDQMRITSINESRVLLEKDNKKYRINY